MMRTIARSSRWLMIAASASVVGALSGCDRSVTAPVLAAPSALVASIVANVYLPTFDSLAVRAARLSSALDALAAAPAPETLEGAREAWRATREMYERNEGFAFGPLQTEGYDPALDTWPIDRGGIVRL